MSTEYWVDLMKKHRNGDSCEIWMYNLGNMMIIDKGRKRKPRLSLSSRDQSKRTKTGKRRTMRDNHFYPCCFLDIKRVIYSNKQTIDI